MFYCRGYNLGVYLNITEKSDLHNKNSEYRISWEGQRPVCADLSRVYCSADPDIRFFFCSRYSIRTDFSRLTQIERGQLNLDLAPQVSKVGR